MFLTYKSLYSSVHLKLFKINDKRKVEFKQALINCTNSNIPSTDLGIRVLLIDFFNSLFYFWLPCLRCCAQAAAVAKSGGCSLAAMCGFLLLWSTGSRHAGFGSWGTQAQLCGTGFSFLTACGIFPDQWLNPHPLHWQANSYPLSQQGKPFSLEA